MSRQFVISFLLIICFFVVSGCFAEGNGADPETVERIGIISAMETEIDLLFTDADIDHVDQIGGLMFHVGTLCGKDVVIVKTGVGKVLAAAGTAALFNRYDIKSLIFTGVAGGVGDQTKVLDIVIGTDVVQHDFGTITDEGFEWSPALNSANGGYYLADESLAELAYNAAADIVGPDHVFKGTIATGDQFIASASFVKELQEKFDAIAVEMEGASVASVCYQYGIPFVVIRAMSDKADGQAHETYENMADIAADYSGSIIMKMLESME